MFESHLLTCLLDIELQDYFILDVIQWLKLKGNKNQFKVAHILFNKRASITKQFNAIPDIKEQLDKFGN